MGQLAQFTAYPVVFVVVLGLLDHVPPDYGLVAVVIVGFVRCEVDLAKELLLVMFEFPNHGDDLYVCDFSDRKSVV